MKFLLPYTYETIVSSSDSEALYKRLWNVTEPNGEDEWMPDVEDEQLMFVGKVKQYGFQLSRRVQRANNYLPLMRGHIESTSLGSIVFIRYRLFLWTFSFLVFWSVLTMIFALYFMVYEEVYVNAIVSLLLGVANYVVAVLNFHRQVKVSSKLLRTVLE